MLSQLIELCRGRTRDKEKAKEHLHDQAESSFQDIVEEYDSFVPYMRKIPESALHIGTAKDSVGNNIPVRLTRDDLYCHWLVQGGTGTGKTSFATWMLSRALCERLPIGVLDCKSGFFDTAIQWAGALAYRMDETKRTEFIQSLAIVNPFGEALAPLNICKVLPGVSPEVQSYEVSLALARLFEGTMSFQMQNILHNLIALLMDAGLTLVEAPDVLQDELLRMMLVQSCRNPQVKEFFLRTYASVPSSSKDAIQTRMQALLLPENLRLMLGADDLIDFKTMLDTSRPLFLFLGKGPSVPEELVEVMGSLIMQLLLQGSYAGGSGQRRSYLLLCDEFFHLLEAPSLNKRFETALTTLRSFGLHLSLVMHNFSQVHGGLRENIINNCDAMALFRTSSRNAGFFGEFLPECDPDIVRESLRKTGRPPSRYDIRGQLTERLQRLPDRHCYLYDRRKPYRALFMRVPDVPLPHESIGISPKSPS